MSDYYVSKNETGHLSVREVARIAQEQEGTLLAVNQIQINHLLDGTHTLSELQDREYLFSIRAKDLKEAEYKASTILTEARKQQETPVYQDFITLLDDTTLDQKQLVARYVREDYGDVEDLLITKPGSGDTPRKIYYRGSIGYACLDLITRFTNVTVIDD